MSYVEHTWRLFAPDDEDVDVAIELGRLVAHTEPTDIDHWFADGMSVFSGRGIPPQHPRISTQICFACLGFGCLTCCFGAVTYHWSGTSERLIQESIDGLHHIIHDLDNPPEQHDIP